MEAIRKYLVEWALILNFNGEQEQALFDNEALSNLIMRAAGENPWLNEYGVSLNHTLMIVSLKQHRELRPEYQPRTVATLQHNNLLLSQKQLWAYETWTQKIAESVRDEVGRILHRITSLNYRVTWDVRMNLQRRSERKQKATSFLQRLVMSFACLMAPSQS